MVAAIRLLSTTSPLIQSYFCTASVRGRIRTGWFALSNAASLAALVAYPVAIELYVGTRMQAGWSTLWAVCALLGAGWRVRQPRPVTRRGKRRFGGEHR